MAGCRRAIKRPPGASRAAARHRGIRTAVRRCTRRATRPPAGRLGRDRAGAGDLADLGRGVAQGHSNLVSQGRRRKTCADRVGVPNRAVPKIMGALRSAPMTHLGGGGGMNDCIASLGIRLAPGMAPKACSRHSVSLFNLVGRTRFELVTSSVSGKRSPAELTAPGPRRDATRAKPSRAPRPSRATPRAPPRRPDRGRPHHPTGRPHVRPVLAVWLDGALYTTSNAAARKGRNLAADPRCSVSARTDTMDMVLEGHAIPVTSVTELNQVAEAYRNENPGHGAASPSKAAPCWSERRTQLARQPGIKAASRQADFDAYHARVAVMRAGQPQQFASPTERYDPSAMASSP